MIQLRRGNDRGHTQLDWLDSRHTFSFGDYHDPETYGLPSFESHQRRSGRSRRRVRHPLAPRHGNIAYVLEGALAHKDSTGTSSVIRVGDVQR